MCILGINGLWPYLTEVLTVSVPVRSVNPSTVPRSTVTPSSFRRHILVQVSFMPRSQSMCSVSKSVLGHLIFPIKSFISS